MTSTKKIALVAGGGNLPKEILKNSGKDFEVIALKNYADEDIASDATWFNIAKVGAILKHLKAKNITEILFAGKVKRPSLLALRPDITGAKLIYKLSSLKNAGDDGLMKGISGFLEDKGFKLLSVPDVYGSSVVQRGNLSDKKPNEEELRQIKNAYEKALEVGRLDIGQAVVLNENNIIAVEGIEGTDKLIERCGSYNLEQKSILIKICKPGQYEKMDLPTIGADTIQNAVNNNFSAVVLQADKTLIVDKEKAIALANENDIILLAI